MSGKLTPTSIKKLKSKSKEYFVSDGNSLYLCVRPNSTKLWVFIYTSPTTNKRRKTSFSTYPLVPISLARKKAQEYRELVFKGIDPIDCLKAKKAEFVTFDVTLLEWLDLKKANVTNKTLKTKRQRIEGVLYPYLKLKPISNIEHPEVVDLLSVKAKLHPYTVERILGYLRNLWQYAVSKGYCKENIINRIHKSSIIPTHTTTHYVKITDKDILQELVQNIF